MPLTGTVTAAPSRYATATTRMVSLKIDSILIKSRSYGLPIDYWIVQSTWPSQRDSPLPKQRLYLRIRPFTLTAAHPSPPAPPHVCHVQPKHPCIACRTHSAQAAPLPRPEHAHTHRLPCRPHVAGPHVSGPGWRLPGCEETFFGAISTCASASSQRCHVRVRLLPCAVASCYLLSCLAVWPVRGRW